ncbi:biotin--[acetyl-CoA-carboxylase] ligase [soil metagenome]
MTADAPAQTDLDALADGLPTITHIRHVASTGSTNADLLAGGVAGEVLVADVQTAGRGRRGRTWVAPPGASLLLSVRLHPALPLSSWTLLPLVAGTAVITAARQLASASTDTWALKWPNDLLADGVKAAGILVEASGPAVVLGIGLNTDWRGLDRPAGLVATSLAEVAGTDVDRWAALAALLAALDRHVRQAELDPTGVVQRYAADCGTIGMQVIAHGPTTVQGRATGLTIDGHLRIRADDGRDHTVTAGDVEHLR